MWPKKIVPALILVLFGASLASCGASLNSGSDRSFRSSAPIASDGLTPGQATAPGSNPRAAQGVDVLTTVATPENAAYKIGPMDVLQISVFKVPELSQTAQVADTGTVNLPLVGEIPAAGRTAHEVERDLTSRLGAKYLNNPQVTVYVKEYNSQRVTVTGDIKKPGVYPLTGKTTLLQVVAMAGGFEATTNWTVLVLRQTNGKRAAAKFDVNQIENGRTEDPTMQAGDVLVAGSSAIKKGYGAILKALPIAGLFAIL